MSIDHYAVDQLESDLYDIESIADSIDIALEDRVDDVGLGDELRELVERAKRHLRDIEDSDDDEDTLELDQYDLESADIHDFKSRVLDSIPYGASMKFRMDVEEMLEKFNGVY